MAEWLPWRRRGGAGGWLRGARAQAPAGVTLAVPGRRTRRRGRRRRAASWRWPGRGRSTASADIFVAASRDEGATFGPPVRVNGVAGEAAWAARFRRASRCTQGRRARRGRGGVERQGRGTEIKMARSRGRRRDVRRARVATGAGRGWRSRLARADPRRPGRGARDLARPPRPGGGRSRPRPRRGGRRHDGVAMAQKSSLYYASSARRAAERAITPGVCYCCKSAIVALPGGTLVRLGATCTPATCATWRSPCRATAAARSRRPRA